MKFNRLVLSSAVLAVTIGFVAGASAQTSGLKATPSPLNLSARGGQLTSGYVTFTNLGPGFASNMAATLGAPNNNGGLAIVSDTCTGATIAQGGTCSVQVQFDAKCFYNNRSAAAWYVEVTSSTFPLYNAKVTTTVTSYSCD